MFQDEGLSSFFRRLTFSPDGSLLLAPGLLTNVNLDCIAALGGKVESVDNRTINVTWVFTRKSFPQCVS